MTDQLQLRLRNRNPDLGHRENCLSLSNARHQWGVKILISYNVIGLHFLGFNEATYCNK